MNAARGAGRLRHVVYALAIKELRESSAALIAGSFIFIGLPVLWTALYWLVDPASEIVAGLATQTFTLCAWLFAPVLAAQAVCRDWGRPVGEFLLARPVSARLAMLVKGVVTFAIILSLVAAVVLLEALIRSFDNPAAISVRLSDAAIAASCVTFWIAFGAAAVTRDTFRSVLLAVFMLVLVTLAPLLSARFSWLAAETGMWPTTDGRMWVIAPFARAVVMGISALGLLAALYGAGSPRAMKITTRAIAWAIALAMLLLFPMAMSEIGNDVSQVTTRWLPSRHGVMNWKTAAGKSRIAILRDEGEVLLFEFTEQGEVIDAPAREDDKGRLWLLHFGPNDGALLVFDESENLHVITSMRYQSAPADQRATFRSINWDTHRTEGSAKLALPDSVSSADFVWVADAAIEDRQLIVLYGSPVNGESTNRTEPTRVMLAVYDLDGENGPSLTSVSEIGYAPAWPQYSFDRRLSRGADGRMYVVGKDGGLPISAAPPEAGYDRFGYVEEPFFRTYGQFVIRRSLTAASTRSGLRVLQGPGTRKDRGAYYDENGRGNRHVRLASLAGYAKASPWSWLFRSDRPLLTYAGPDRVWEVHRDRGRAICYDVSNPRRPRRIAHVTSYRIVDAVSGPEFLVLDHGLGFSIVRHPK